MGRISRNFLLEYKNVATNGRSYIDPLFGMMLLTENGRVLNLENHLESLV